MCRYFAINPAVGSMFGRGKYYGYCLWQAYAKYMFGIVGDFRGIAMTPFREDFVTVGNSPVEQPIDRDCNPRLFFQFA